MAGFALVRSQVSIRPRPWIAWDIPVAIAPIGDYQTRKLLRIESTWLPTLSVHRAKTATTTTRHAHTARTTAAHTTSTTHKHQQLPQQQISLRPLLTHPTFMVAPCPLCSCAALVRVTNASVALPRVGSVEGFFARILTNNRAKPKTPTLPHCPP